MLHRILWSRALRAFADGYVALLLPVYLVTLGFSAFHVGLIATITLVGSGLMTLLVGAHAHRYDYRTLLIAAALLMAATGLSVAAVTDLWPLLVIAFVGTLNPSGGGGVFMPLEHAIISEVTKDSDRTAVFARYSLVGTLVAALFCVDSFAGGLIMDSLLVLWLFERFELSPAVAGAIFFWVGVLSAFSYLVAARIARRIGLVNTMVFTHLPSSVFLILVPFMPTLGWAIALLLARSALSQMDVPTRTSYVMAIVPPEERPAAASVTSVPRTFASALGPVVAGSFLSTSTFGWPLVAAGALKITYDLMLLYTCRDVRPPEEIRA